MPEQEHFLDLEDSRSSLGLEFPFSPAQIARMKEEFLLPVENEISQARLGEPAEILERLLETKQEYQRRVGKIPSRPYLSALEVGEISLNLLMVARECLEEGFNPALFNALFDHARGIERIAWIIIIAESFIAGELDQPFLKAKEEIEERYASPIPLIDEAETWIFYQQIGRRFAELLKKDPSGFSLIDNYISNLKEHPYLNFNNGSFGAAPVQVAEFFISGAEFGRKAYKKFYKVAEQLPL